MKPCGHRQHGAIAIMYAMMLTTLIGFIGLAVDMGLMYLRRTQLQSAADTIALNAASKLNGTTAGVSAARSQAQLSANSTGNLLVWSDNALTLSADPDAPDASWLSVSAAMATPANNLYARVDTRQLAGNPGLMQPRFMGVLGAAVAPVNLAGVAVAGPRALNVLPVAICAMGPASAARANGPTVQELVEYGFRYGVGYNLLKLNPAAGAATGEYFYIDPTAPPGTPSQPANTSDTALAPFICNGKLAYPNLDGGPLNLKRPSGFTMWQQLNSRFDSYDGAPACNPDAAPPDTNIRAFTAANAVWMNNPAALQTAQASTPAAGKPLNTVADAAPPLPAVAPGLYGVLWTLSAARRSTGSSSFATSFWQALYPATPPLAPGAWTAGSPPYRNPAYTSAPSHPGRAWRRLLYVPLLACPVAAGQYATAPMQAVARFLMTAPATASELNAEFAGVLTVPTAGEPGLTADVELFR